MRRDAHHRACSVLGEDKIRHPDRHLLAGKWIHGEAAGKEAFLLGRGDVRGARAFLPHSLEASVRRSAPRHSLEQFAQLRMPGGHNDGGGAVNRVHARRENLKAHVGHSRDVESHPCAFRFADPVSLHHQNALRPSGRELRHIREQLVRILRDSQEPLLEFLLLDLRRLMPPTKAVNHLFIGQNSEAFGTPIDLALFAVRDSLLEHAQEKPLVPLVILRLASGNFAAPVVAESEALQDPAELLYVCVRPIARVNSVLDGGVFRRQSEGVPAHGMQHVVPAHPLVARHGVADGVIAHVAHVQRAGGIWQHFEQIVFRAGSIAILSVKCALLVPNLLPLRFDPL